MEEYIKILQALKGVFSSMSAEEIELYFRVVIIGAIGGILFYIYLIGKLIRGIKASISSFIQGYRSK